MVAGEQRFDFRFTAAHRLPALAFGITPATAAVVVDAAELRARFGPWLLRTRRANIRDAVVTGPYRLSRTAGPARLSAVDRGLTFATNGDVGVCIRFREPVPGLDPFGWLRHPALTVTVTDVVGLVGALRPTAV